MKHAYRYLTRILGATILGKTVETLGQISSYYGYHSSFFQPLPYSIGELQTTWNEIHILLCMDLITVIFAFLGTLGETTINQHRHTSLMISVDVLPQFIVIKCTWLKTGRKWSTSFSVEHPNVKFHVGLKYQLKNVTDPQSYHQWVFSEGLQASLNSWVVKKLHFSACIYQNS